MATKIKFGLLNNYMLNDVSDSWVLLGELNNWATLVVTIESILIAFGLFCCGYKILKHEDYNEFRSFVMVSIGIWVLIDGVTKLIRFLTVKQLPFSPESIYLAMSRFGTAVTGIIILIGIYQFYKNIKSNAD